MRILLSPIGSRGDVQPMLALALKLRERGQELLFCAPPDFEAWMGDHGLSFRPVGVDMKSTLESAYGDGAGLKTVTKLVTEILEDQFAALGEACREFEPEVIIGGGLQCAGPTLAEIRGIPYVYAAYCTNFIRSAAHAPVFFSAQKLPRLGNRLLWKLYLRIGNAAMLPVLNRVRDELGLAPVTDGYTYVFEPRHVLLATDETLAPAPRDFGSHIFQTGFWFLDEPTPLPRELVDFVRAGDRPIYLGFGSVPIPDAPAFAAMIEKVFFTTRRRFVIGCGDLRETLERSLPDSCCVVDAVDHGELFPLMEAVIHHGSAGTTAVAARSAVPQIVVPHAADQFYWGRRVAQLGIGSEPLPFKRLTARALARRIDLVTSSPTVKEAAEAVGTKLRRSDGVGNAAAIVESILGADELPSAS